MGRRPTVNLNLPKGMRARKRTRKNGTVVTYYFYDGRDENGRRKEYPLGTDYVLAVQEWGRLEQEGSQAAAAATFTAAAARYTADVLVHRADNTQRNSRLLLKNLICFFGNPDAPLDQIQPQHIRQQYTQPHSNAHPGRAYQCRTQQPAMAGAGRNHHPV